VFYGVSDGITNPIVPLGNGCTVKTAVTGSIGVNGTPAVQPQCFDIPLLAPGALNEAIPSNDPYETTFTTGQRNIFTQSWQKRLDVSFVKYTKLNDRLGLKYSFDIFNITNTPSFDIPVDDVTQNENFNGFPLQGTPALPTVACTANPDNGANTGFYNCPQGLGVVNKTIGSARQMQMSLKLTF